MRINDSLNNIPSVLKNFARTSFALAAAALITFVPNSGHEIVNAQQEPDSTPTSLFLPVVLRPGDGNTVPPIVDERPVENIQLLTCNIADESERISDTYGSPYDTVKYQRLAGMGGQPFSLIDYFDTLGIKLHVDILNRNKTIGSYATYDSGDPNDPILRGDQIIIDCLNRYGLPIDLSLIPSNLKRVIITNATLGGFADGLAYTNLGAIVISGKRVNMATIIHEWFHLYPHSRFPYAGLGHFRTKGYFSGTDYDPNLVIEYDPAIDPRGKESCFETLLIGCMPRQAELGTLIGLGTIKPTEYTTIDIRNSAYGKTRIGGLYQNDYIPKESWEKRGLVIELPNGNQILVSKRANTVWGGGYDVTSSTVIDMPDSALQGVTISEQIVNGSQVEQTFFTNSEMVTKEGLYWRPYAFYYADKYGDFEYTYYNSNGAKHILRINVSNYDPTHDTVEITYNDSESVGGPQSNN